MTDPKWRTLPRAFYRRPAVQVARDLLGKHLVHRVEGVTLAGRIVETEAYLGPEDLACHAAKGKTARTAIMFGPPGHAYVYLIYGMYHCFNVVCEREGFPAAVLVRAIEPESPGEGKTDGPGKLCRALRITRADNGLDLLGDVLAIEDRGGPTVEPVATPRIGIDYAGPPWVEAPLRFVDATSLHLSRKLGPTRKRAAPAAEKGARRRR